MVFQEHDHVGVLILDLYGAKLGPVAPVYGLNRIHHELLAGRELPEVMVTYQELQLRMLTVGTDAVQVVEALIPFRGLRGLVRGHQIYELVLRCIKTTEVRHYYDIAVIGYGDDASYGWKGTLAGRDFVSPEELKNNPFKTITVKEETRTRKGVELKEVHKVQWIEPVAAGKYTRGDKAFTMAKNLLDKWMKEHHDKDCYPPTIINITDGALNGIVNPREVNTQLANELKALFTNDGNVLLWNIHITPDSKEQLVFPISKTELNNDKYSEWMYDMSSLLPSRYNVPIGDLRGDAENTRHVAMATNTDMSTLIQLMDIGTPTNISQNQ